MAFIITRPGRQIGCKLGIGWGRISLNKSLIYANIKDFRRIFSNNKENEYSYGTTIPPTSAYLPG